MNDSDDVEQDSVFLSYLQLLRLPNIFTAMADVAMGFLFVQTPWAWDETGAMRPGAMWILGLLIAGSSLLYASGVVLNDVFDLERDRGERPDRPLPSGQISLRAARWLGWELLLLGTVLPCGVGMLLYQIRPDVAIDIALRPAAVAILLALAIVLYNAVLKETVVGPLAMGGCRMLNVLLGMSVLGAPLAPEHWLVAGAIGVYITGVTWFARSDFERSDRRQLFVAMMIMMGGVGMLAGLPSWSADLLPWIQQDPQQWNLIKWYLVMGLLGAIIAFRCLWAISEPEPGRVRVAVAQAIVSLVFLDAAACCASRGTYWAALILLLLAPIIFLERWIEGT